MAARRDHGIGSSLITDRILPLAEALARLLHGLAPVCAPARTPENLPLCEALGRVLAEPVRAPRAQPHLSVSAMDGYGVRSADVASGAARLRLIGTAAAGAAPRAAPVGLRCAVRIFTGGLVPAGADRVVIQEHVRREGDIVHIDAPQTGPTHIRAAGIDYSAGDILVESGVRARAIHIALAASANYPRLALYRRPRLLVFSSGDELVGPGADLTDQCLVNSAGYGVLSLIREWGGEGRLGPILPDRLEACRDALKASMADADVLVTIGGASVGDHDVVKPAMAKLGAHILFEKVAIKPGKPVWHGRFDDGRLVLGLPGNPASALVCAFLFLRPLLVLLAGENVDAKVWTRARLGASLPANGPRETFLRARATMDDTHMTVQADHKQDSSLLTPFVSGNALIRRAPGAEAAAAGTPVDMLAIGPVAGLLPT